jgi:iron donor protein CyaY
MQDESEFRKLAERALEALKKHLFVREEQSDAGFEVEEQSGVLTVLFDDPGSRFVITANAAVRQIWISALSTSFKLDWSAEAGDFLLPRTAEHLQPLVDRLIEEQSHG